MAVQSTLRTYVVRHCAPTVHPWTPSCTRCAFDILRKSAVICLSQFSLIYAVGTIIKASKTGADLNLLRQYMIDICRSTLFVSLFFCNGVLFTCVVRAILGAFYQWSSIFIPAVIGASAIVLENPKRWNMFSFLCGNSLLERLLLVWKRDKGLPLSPSVLTGIFMVGSGVLMYLLRHPEFFYLLHGGENTWLFYPPPLNEKSQDEDSAPGALQKQLMMAVRLLAMGVALQVVPIGLRYALRPAALGRRLAQLRTYRLGAFLGGHAALYLVCRWALRRALGRAAAWHAFPAGLLAGAAFRVFADRTYATAPIAVAIQILLKWYCKKTNAAKTHVAIGKVLFFCTAFAYLGHVFYTDMGYSPSWTTASIHKFSGGIATGIRERFLKQWHTNRFTILQAGL